MIEWEARRRMEVIWESCDMVDGDDKVTFSLNCTFTHSHCILTLSFLVGLRQRAL